MRASRLKPLKNLGVYSVDGRMPYVDSGIQKLRGIGTSQQTDDATISNNLRISLDVLLTPRATFQAVKALISAE